VPGTVILRSQTDEVEPFLDSEELVRSSGLPPESLTVVGSEHRLADEESLKAMVKVVVEAAGVGHIVPNLPPLRSRLGPTIKFAVHLVAEAPVK
jgi:hypothetical protein